LHRIRKFIGYTINDLISRRKKSVARKGRKKVKDLVDMLEDPENSGYIGGDYEDMMELLEQELSESEDEQDQEVVE
jgi:hypothetical protein